MVFWQELNGQTGFVHLTAPMNQKGKPREGDGELISRSAAMQRIKWAGSLWLIIIATKEKMVWRA
jgi:hypothetical protein